MIGIILSVAGIAVTLYVAYRQQKKGNVHLALEIEEEEYDPSSDDWIYQNSDANKSIEVKIKVASRHDVQLDLQIFAIAVSSIQSFSRPHCLIRNSAIRENIALEPSGVDFPARLKPGSSLETLRLNGYAVASALEERGYEGKVNIMFAITDKNKNGYYTRPLVVDIEEWGRDRGDFVMGFISV